MVKKILDVPKIKQLKGYCGPTSLAMVLNYYGVSVNQEEIVLEMGPWEFGFCDQDILTYARSRGFIAHPYEGITISKLIQLIDRDIPVITRTEHWSNSEVAHMSVVKGYDLNLEKLIINDPTDLRRNNVTFEKFKRLWVVCDNGYSKNYAISIRSKDNSSAL